jgi:hypothetical protein
MRAARREFNPCLLLGIVYICGSGSMEAFAPQTDTFLPLFIPLPEANHPCCLFEYKNLLVLHSYSYILKFAVEGQLAKCSEVRSPQVSKCQNSQPVVDKEKGVFYIIQTGNIMSYNVETGVKAEQ